MNLSCLFSLGDGITFHRFRKNPFRRVKPGCSSFLDSVKPADTRPIQPALEGRRTLEASGLSTSTSSPTKFERHPAPVCPSRSLSRSEKVETLILKLLAITLALSCIGCGFGVQHIAHVRQKHELCRQLRQKEIELRAVTQAYRSLESSVIAKAAEDFRRTESYFVVAKRASQKAPTRG